MRIWTFQICCWRLCRSNTSTVYGYDQISTPRHQSHCTHISRLWWQCNTRLCHRRRQGAWIMETWIAGEACYVVIFLHVVDYAEMRVTSRISYSELAWCLREVFCLIHVCVFFRSAGMCHNSMLLWNYILKTLYPCFFQERPRVGKNDFINELG